MADRLRRALLARENLLPLLAACVYLVNRFVVSLEIVMPLEFARYHLGDLCGGIIFPAYVNVLTRTVAGGNLIVDLGSSLLLSALCSFCWEFVASRIFLHGTADPLDALVYFIGGLVYLVGFKIAERREGR